MPTESLDWMKGGAYPVELRSSELSPRVPTWQGGFLGDLGLKAAVLIQLQKLEPWQSLFWANWSCGTVI